jgi:heme O synthase-like polyprenyltransferase
MPSFSDLLGLCKLKVVALILLTAVVGMFLAVPAPYFPDLILVALASLGIGLASASAAVFNHIVDEQIDLQMSRTHQRPLPQGKVSRNQALAWGVFLGVIGLGILQLFVNTITMVLTFISLIGYAVIYTLATSAHRPFDTLLPEKLPMPKNVAASKQIQSKTTIMVLTFISLIGYAVIYTMYLKRATPQNIVIGGAANLLINNMIKHRR